MLATLSVSASGNLVNTASVTPPSGVTDPNPANNSATDTDTITPVIVVADLAITKTDGVASVTAGAATAYTIVVSNAGPSSANDAVLTDPAVANLTITSVSCGSATGGAMCPTVFNTTVALMQGAGIVIPTLPAGGSVTFMVNATVASGFTRSISNIAQITAPTGVNDPTPANNSATDSNAVGAISSLALTKSAGSASYQPGDVATYTIIVTNSGPSSANNVTVTDNLPAGLTLAGNATCIASGVATGGSINGVTGATIFTATGATIAAGASNRLVYSLPVRFAAGLATSLITNIATASDPAMLSAVSATDTVARARSDTAAIPIDDGRALLLLSFLIILMAGWRVRARS